MSWIISFLIDWGYWGMLAAAFLAGSFFPFSSEAVMAEPKKNSKSQKLSKTPL